MSNPVATTSPDPMVSLTDLKEHLRVTHNKEDNLYMSYLAAATERIEAQTDQVFMPRQFQWKIAGFYDPDTGASTIAIPGIPLLVLDTIEYYDESDVLTDLDVSEVWQETRIQTCIWPKSDDGWPQTSRRPDAVTISYSAGYADIESVPEAAQTAAKLLVAHWDNNRSAVESMQMNDVPQSLLSLLRTLHIGKYVGQP